MADKAKLAADGVAVVSGIAASHVLVQVDLVVDILAGIFAIGAAIVSIYMHCTRRAQRKKEDEKKGPDK